jgi:hypothetical protein
MMPPTASKTKRSRNEKSADNHDTHGFEFPLLVPMIGHNALPCRNGVALRAHSLTNPLRSEEKSALSVPGDPPLVTLLPHAAKHPV